MSWTALSLCESCEFFAGSNEWFFFFLCSPLLDHLFLAFLGFSVFGEKMVIVFVWLAACHWQICLYFCHFLWNILTLCWFIITKHYTMSTSLRKAWPGRTETFSPSVLVRDTCPALALAGITPLDTSPQTPWKRSSELAKLKAYLACCPGAS